MTFLRPDTASTLAFLLIVISVLSAFLLGTYFASRKLGKSALRNPLLAAVMILGWNGLVSLVVSGGIIRDTPMPGIPLFFFLVNLAGVLFALSPLGWILATGLPIQALVGFQAFRFPLELVLYSWAGQGSIPWTMTWSGQNLDIITGVLALIAAPMAGRFRQAAWIVNIVGFALLLNVGRVAMLSSPLPFAWSVTPPLQLVLYLPYAWIGSICVAGALAGHLILTRKLVSK